MTVSLKLDGTDKLLKQFRIEEEKMNKEVAKAMAKFAGKIEADAVKLTPVRLGELEKRSFTSGPEYDPDTHQYVMIVGYEKEGQTFDHRYAVPVHERTYARHHNGQAKFLETAVKENAQEYLDYMAEVLRKELKK